MPELNEKKPTYLGVMNPEQFGEVLGKVLRKRAPKWKATIVTTEEGYVITLQTKEDEECES